MAMRSTARINGLQMVWDEFGARGTGSALLLVHGFPLNRSMWEPQCAALADAAFIVAPDLRGHGETEAPPGPYDMETFADDLAALLDWVDLPRVVYCGLSLGGYIGFAFARRHSQRLAGLILADTRSGPDGDQRRAGREELASAVELAGSSALAVERLRPPLVAPETRRTRPDLLDRLGAMIAGTPATGLAGAARGIAARPDSVPTLGRITVPTLIVVGAEDELTPPAESEMMHAAIPGSRLEVLPGAGHLSNLERPAAFNAAVRQHLKRC